MEPVRAEEMPRYTLRKPPVIGVGDESVRESKRTTQMNTKIWRITQKTTYTHTEQARDVHAPAARQPCADCIRVLSVSMGKRTLSTAIPVCV